VILFSRARHLAAAGATLPCRGGTPIRHLQTALSKLLRDEGKIQHIGLSEVSIEQLLAAQRVTTIASVQNLFNLAIGPLNRCSTRAAQVQLTDEEFNQLTGAVYPAVARPTGRSTS
jgi:hypothetical protein